MMRARFLEKHHSTRETLLAAMAAAAMTTPQTPSSYPQPTISGKFFRINQAKFYPRGVTYGPFAPNAAGEPFASREQTGPGF